MNRRLYAPQTVKHSPQAVKPATHSPSRDQAPPLARSGTASGGQMLDRHTQARMSARFGHDFSRVRVHTDALAGATAAALGANAFAHGSDVVFGEGQWTPGSPQTERLLAHELTHVVQQDRWGVGDWGRASARGDASEREADGLAAQVMAGRSVDVRAAPQAALARDQDDPSAQVSTLEDPSAQVSRLGDPEPDVSAPVGTPRLPDPRRSAPVAPAAPGPVYGPQDLPRGPIYGPQARPADPPLVYGPQPLPDSEDVSSPLDPSSRTCAPDPDPADVSCGMDPDDLTCRAPEPVDPFHDYPWGPAKSHQAGEKPGDVSGPYSFWSDDPDNTHNEAGLYHGHGTLADGEFEATSDLGYYNADSGTYKDDQGMEHHGLRANAGMVNTTLRADDASLNLQAATAGGEASIDSHGFNLNAGATTVGVTGTVKGDNGSVSLGVSGGPQIGVGFRCGDREDDLYDGATECCFSEQFGPFNGQVCADGDALFGQSLEDRVERAKIKADDKQYAEKVKAWHDERVAQEAEAQQRSYVYATPEQRKSLPHSWSDDIAAAVSDRAFAETPPADRVSRGDATPEDIFGYSAADPVCRADEPSCPAPLLPEAPPAAAPDPQVSTLAPGDEPPVFGPQLPPVFGPQLPGGEQ